MIGNILFFTLSFEILSLLSPIFSLIVLTVLFQFFISLNQNRTPNRVYLDHLQNNLAIVFFSWKLSLFILLISCSYLICLFIVFSIIKINSVIIVFPIILLIAILVIIFDLWLFSKLFQSKFVEYNNRLILSLYDSFVAIPFSAFIKVIIDQYHKRIQITFRYCIAKNSKSTFQSVFHCQNSKTFDSFTQILLLHNLPVQFISLNFVSSFITMPFRLITSTDSIFISNIPIKLSTIPSN